MRTYQWSVKGDLHPAKLAGRPRRTAGSAIRAPFRDIGLRLSLPVPDRAGEYVGELGGPLIPVDCVVSRERPCRSRADNSAQRNFHRSSTTRSPADCRAWNPLLGVATTGRFVARYSCDLIASRLKVKSSTRCGQIRTSAATSHEGTAVDGTDPSSRTVASAKRPRIFARKSDRPNEMNGPGPRPRESQDQIDVNAVRMHSSDVKTAWGPRPARVIDAASLIATRSTSIPNYCRCDLVALSPSIGQDIRADDRRRPPREFIFCANNPRVFAVRRSQGTPVVGDVIDDGLPAS